MLSYQPVKYTFERIEDSRDTRKGCFENQVNLRITVEGTVCSRRQNVSVKTQIPTQTISADPNRQLQTLIPKQLHHVALQAIIYGKNETGSCPSERRNSSMIIVGDEASNSKKMLQS